MFDPYHRWLGIPTGTRPPTHYQLLGISPKEDDPEVIEAAVIRQTSYLRNFQSGPDGQDCGRILGELALARLTLLDPSRRKAYDAGLSAPAPPPPPEAGSRMADEPPGPSSDGFATELVLSEPTTRPRSRPRRKSSGAFLRTAIHLAITAAGIVAITLMIRAKLHDRPSPTALQRPPETPITSPGPTAPDMLADLPRERPPARPEGEPPREARAFGGHHYQRFDEPTTWHVARRKCEEKGGHLATVADKGEDDFLRELAGGKDFWLGGTDEEKEGEWRWVTGEPFRFTHWAGAPDNHGGQQHHTFYWNGRGWDDDAAGSRIGYICEWDR